MGVNISFVICLVGLMFMLTLVGFSNCCNEAVCASIVSKCMITQDCKCQLKNCTCCKPCFDCLSYLYSECCSCMELCPKPIDEHHGLRHSQVGECEKFDAMPDLFKTLTEEQDFLERWSVLTFPVDIDQDWFQPVKVDNHPSSQAFVVGESQIVVDPSKHFVTVNCTVVYMAQCMPIHKCKTSCGSMGASYFRWFHDGCCECVGQTCLNYGVNESRCSVCSRETGEEWTEEIGDEETIEES